MASVSWERPSGGWVKLNTDGCARGSPGAAGGGGVIRDEKGRWLMGFTRNLGCCTSIVAELLAARDGLRLAWDCGFRKVICEVDAAAVLTMINTQDPDLSTITGRLTAECRELILRNWKCTMTHTVREGNCCADALSKLGPHVAVPGVLVFVSPPPTVFAHFCRDYLGVPMLREKRVVL